MPPQNSCGQNRDKASHLLGCFFNTESSSLFPDNKITIDFLQFFQTTETVPSTALPITFLNIAANSKDFLSRLLTPNNHTSKPLKSLDLIKKLFNNFGIVYYDWSASSNLSSPDETPKISRWSTRNWKDIIANSSN